MKSSAEEITPLLGTELDGGIYGGRIQINGQAFALIVAPKATGEHAPAIWIPKYKDVPAKSYFDGLANTRAMSEGGSKLAQWAIDLEIGGHNDWYLPSQDELEVIYRNLKPTTEKNWCYARSGINLSAIDPTRPYTPDMPVQTLAEVFQKGGGEAFDEAFYWSSTQHVSGSGYAWNQDFTDGGQYYYDTFIKFRARAVRRSPI